MDSNLCAKLYLRDTLVETEQQQQEENWIFWINQVPIMRYMLFVTIQISLMCQKLDLIEIESETRMQDNLCHPYH